MKTMAILVKKNSGKYYSPLYSKSKSYTSAPTQSQPKLLVLIIYLYDLKLALNILSCLTPSSNGYVELDASTRDNGVTIFILSSTVGEVKCIDIMLTHFPLG